MCDKSKLWIALWGPTATLLATVIASAIAAGPACSSIRQDVASIKRSVDRLADRVEIADRTAVEARREAQEALARVDRVLRESRKSRAKYLEE
jgi:hypothetical protein